MTDDQELHYVYRNDPLELMSYVGQMVEVSVVNGERSPRQGYVHTVDPVTGSYVLYRTDEADRLTVEIIPGPKIESVKRLLQEDVDVSGAAAAIAKLHRILNQPCPEQDGTGSTVCTEARKKTVSAWLRRNLVPVADGVDDPTTLTIMNALTITPPYGPDNCLGENEIILGKVQGLLKAIPDNWDESDFSQ